MPTLNPLRTAIPSEFLRLRWEAARRTRDTKIFGRALKQMLEMHKLKKAHLAEKIWGVRTYPAGGTHVPNQNMVGDWTRGKTLPQEDNLERICQAFAYSKLDIPLQAIDRDVRLEVHEIIKEDPAFAVYGGSGEGRVRIELTFPSVAQAEYAAAAVYKYAERMKVELPVAYYHDGDKGEVRRITVNDILNWFKKTP